MNLTVGKTALITTDNWFMAPDGKQYRAVFGTINGVHGDEETLGIRTNARSTNWYVSIGNMVVAGCQIHYAIQTDREPKEEVRDQSDNNGEVKDFWRRTYIYNADVDCKDSSCI